MKSAALRRDSFLVLDKLRHAAGVRPETWARQAEVSWFRYLKFRCGETAPSAAELARFQRVLGRVAGVAGRAA